MGADGWTLIKASNKKPGETTLVTYTEGEVENTYLVTFGEGEDGYCYANVPDAVAQVMLQGALYERANDLVAEVEAEDVVEPVEEPEAPGESEEEDELTQIHGVGPKVAGKLRDAGFNTIAEVSEAHVNVLVEDCGVTESLAEKLIANAKELLS